MFSLALSAVASFPVTQIDVTDAQIISLNSSALPTRTAEANNVVGYYLRRWASDPQNMILLKRSDIQVDGKYPDTTIDNSCSHKIQALDNSFSGTIRHDSYLNGSLSLARGQPPAIFAEAYLDSALAIGSSARVSTGAKLFGHCDQIARDTVALEVGSTGQSLIGSELALQNVHLKMANGTLSLAFNLNFTLQAKIMTWNVSEVSASHGCKLKILGITILSICGWMEKEIQKSLQPLITGITTVTVPALLERLQEKVQAKIGDEILIPLNKKKSDAERSVGAVGTCACPAGEHCAMAYGHQLCLPNVV